MSALARDRSSKAQVRSAPSCSNMKSQCVARGEPGGISWRKTTKRGMREILLFQIDRGLVFHGRLLRQAVAAQHGLQHGFARLQGAGSDSEGQRLASGQLLDGPEPHLLLVDAIGGPVAHGPEL